MADLGINVIFEGRNLVRILEGLGVTVGISALSVVLSLILGVFVGLGMRSRWRALRWLMQLYLESCASCPRSSSSSSAYFGLTRVAGINLDGITASVLVFTLWGGAEMGDSYEARSSRSLATSTSPPTLWDSPRSRPCAASSCRKHCAGLRPRPSTSSPA